MGGRGASIKGPGASGNADWLRIETPREREREANKTPEERRVEAFEKEWGANNERIVAEAERAAERAFTLGNQLRVGLTYSEDVSVNGVGVPVMVQRLTAQQRKDFGTKDKFRVKIGEGDWFFATRKHHARSGYLDALFYAANVGRNKAFFGE